MEEVLKCHNDYRAKHMNTPPLEYGPQLVEEAQEHCKVMCDKNAFIHASYEDRHCAGPWRGCVGENIYSTPQKGAGENPNFSCDKWYSEINDYDYKRNNTAIGKKGSGHFRAMVWKDTQYLACAVCTCDKLDQGKWRWTNVVCRYNRAGNWPGENKMYVQKLLDQGQGKAPGTEKQESVEAVAEEPTQDFGGAPKPVAQGNTPVPTPVATDNTRCADARKTLSDWLQSKEDEAFHSADSKRNLQAVEDKDVVTDIANSMRWKDCNTKCALADNVPSTGEAGRLLQAVEEDPQAALRTECSGFAAAACAAVYAAEPSWPAARNLQAVVDNGSNCDTVVGCAWMQSVLAQRYVVASYLDSLKAKKCDTLSQWPKSRRLNLWNAKSRILQEMVAPTRPSLTVVADANTAESKKICSSASELQGYVDKYWEWSSKQPKEDGMTGTETDDKPKNTTGDNTPSDKPADKPSTDGPYATLTKPNADGKFSVNVSAADYSTKCKSYYSDFKTWCKSATGPGSLTSGSMVTDMMADGKGSTVKLVTCSAKVVAAVVALIALFAY